MQYSQEYENSLHFSPRFQEYARSLASRLVERHNLYNKDIIEIGCGRGDFLKLLCELGENRGVGFDPSFVHDRSLTSDNNRISFIQDFYSERYANYDADLICCRHVLEHVQFPRELLMSVRHAIRSRSNTVVFFEVPNVMFTLKDMGIWDLIYEHPSYFSTTSFARTFTSCGFRVHQLSERFEGQFLCIEALPVEDWSHPEDDHWDGTEGMEDYVAAFADRYRSKVEAWRHEMERIEHAREKAVVWGGGSKGMTFLNTFKLRDQIEYVVDINPHKHGKYAPGTGQKIIPPEFLQEYRPDVIILMNPIYLDEIRQITEGMNITARLVAV